MFSESSSLVGGDGDHHAGDQDTLATEVRIDTRSTRAQQIDEISLVKIAQHYQISLKPQGPGRFRALCPFHQERTPSFWITEGVTTRGVTKRPWFHCYGCGRHGDVIDFVSRAENASKGDVLAIIEDGGLEGLSTALKCEAVTLERDEDDLNQVVQYKIYPLRPVPEGSEQIRGDDSYTVDIFNPNGVPDGQRGPNDKPLITRLPINRLHPYKNEDGKLLGFVVRSEFVRGDEGELKREKITPQVIFASVSWDAEDGGTEQYYGWVMTGFPNPKPIYGLDFMKKHAKACDRAGKPRRALFVEGEKAADSLRAALRGVKAESSYLVVAWPGGSNNVHQLDFSPLDGWEGYFWEDADQSGRDAMAKAARFALQAGLTRALRVQPPEGVVKGWDAADACGEGWGAERILEHVRSVAQPFGAGALVDQTADDLNEEISAGLQAFDDASFYDVADQPQLLKEAMAPAKPIASKGKENEPRPRFVPVRANVTRGNIGRVPDPLNDERIDQILETATPPDVIQSKETWVRIGGLLTAEAFQIDQLVLPNHATLGQGGMHFLGLTELGEAKVLQVGHADEGYGRRAETRKWLVNTGQAKQRGAALRWGMDNAPVRVACSEPLYGQLLANAFREEVQTGKLTIAAVASVGELADVRWPDPDAAHRVIVIASPTAKLAGRDLRALAEHYEEADCGVALVQEDIVRIASKKRDRDSLTQIRKLQVYGELTLEEIVLTDEWQLDHSSWASAYGPTITSRAGLFSRRVLERMRRLLEDGEKRAYKDLLTAPGQGLCSKASVRFELLDRTVRSALPKAKIPDFDPLFETEVFESARQIARIRTGDTASFVRVIEPDEDDEDGQVEIKPICDAFDVVAKSRNEFEESWGAAISWTNPDGREQTFTIQSTLLSEPRKALAALLDRGWRCDIRKLQDAAQILMYLSPKRRVLTYLQGGWKTVTAQNGEPADAFVFGNTTFYPRDVDTDAENFEGIVLSTGRNALDGFKSRGTSQDWYDNLGRLMVGNPTLQLSASIALAAPLLKLLGMQGGGIHFHGDSSNGKSTLQLYASSLLGGGGGGDLRGYIVSWRITDNRAESFFYHKNDLLVILDEFGMCEGRQIGDIIYMLNGQGKGRATRDAEGREIKTWTILLLSSGEKTLAQKMAEAKEVPAAGQLVRFAEISLNSCGYPRENGVILDFESHGFRSSKEMAEYIRDVSRDHYGQVIRDWLGIIINDKEAILGRVREFIELFRGKFVKDDFASQVKRVGDRFALIAAAGAVAAEQGLFPGQPDEFIEGVGSLYLVWVNDRGNAEEQSEIMLLKEHVRSRLTELQPRFTKISGTTVIRDAYAPQMGFERENRGHTELLVHDQNKPTLRQLVPAANLDVALKRLADDGWIVRGGDRLAKNVKTPLHRGAGGGKYVVFDLTVVMSDGFGPAAALDADEVDTEAQNATEREQLDQILDELLSKQIRVAYRQLGGEPRSDSMLAKRVLDIAIDLIPAHGAIDHAGVSQIDARDALEGEGICIRDVDVGIKIRSTKLIELARRLSIKTDLARLFAAGGFTVQSSGLATMPIDRFLAWIDRQDGRPPREWLEPLGIDDDEGLAQYH